APPRPRAPTPRPRRPLPHPRLDRAEGRLETRRDSGLRQPLVVRKLQRHALVLGQGLERRPHPRGLLRVHQLQIHHHSWIHYVSRHQLDVGRRRLAAVAAPAAPPPAPPPPPPPTRPPPRPPA